MAKIVHFPKLGAQSPLEFLKESCDLVAEEYSSGEEEIIGVLVAFKCKNGQVLTGYYNLDFGAKQELTGHIQCDIIDQMIRANLDRYLEH